ncbi:QRFP-like peptide receptor [Paramacrobiotus metropolitanus]|uniref:QRFP-like peptide receptor n=1 Tax=Paramacrobiotus metropolitanus TaxID=2943436 RepID=UPI00244590FF|nr:QRFP-like peptide receptor [Paramacrobiotus metropolitanus]
MNVTTPRFNQTLPPFPPLPKPPYPVLLTWLILGVTLAILSALLSGLLILVILRSPALRRGAGAIIAFSLTINAVLSGILQPVYFLQVFFVQTDRPLNLHCGVYMLLRLSFIYTEYWTSLVLALNRLVAIAVPHMYRRLIRPPVLVVAMGVSVTVPLLVNMPTLYNTIYLSGRFPPLMACTMKPLNDTLMIINATVGTYFPITSLGVIYVFIAGYVLLRKVTDAGRRMARRVAVAKMLFISYLIYVVCFLPVTILATFYPFILFRSPQMMMWMVMIQLVGFAAAPVIYLVMNEEYRNCISVLCGKVRTAPEVSATISYSNTRFATTKKMTKAVDSNFDD